MKTDTSGLPFSIWMDLKSFHLVLDSFFDRAIVSLSYDAAEKLAQHITADGNRLLDPTFTILSLTSAFVFFQILPSILYRNECAQNTFSILLSKLITYVMIPIEIQKSCWLALPAIIFYMTLYSLLCTAFSKMLPAFKKHWDNIVPYLIVFCTSSILKTIQMEKQTQLVCILVTCYFIWADSINGWGYIKDFLDSIVSRGIVIVIEAHVFGRIHRGATISLSFFYLCIILCIHIILKPQGKKASNPHVCIVLGVLLYSFSSHFVQSVQTFCGNNLSSSFLVSLTLLLILVYHLRLTVSLMEFCTNILSIIWSSMFRSFTSSTYHHWEPLVVYLIVFLCMQAVKDRLAQLLDITSSLSLSYDVKQLSKEIVLIANENESTNPILTYDSYLDFPSADTPQHRTGDKAQRGHYPSIDAHQQIHKGHGH